MASAFPANRFVQAGVAAAQIATLQAAWALLSDPVKDAEARYIAGLSSVAVAAIGSFPASGGGYPVPSPPAGQVIEINSYGAGSLAIGRSTDGSFGLPTPTGVGLELVITGDELQEINFNVSSL